MRAHAFRLPAGPSQPAGSPVPAPEMVGRCSELRRIAGHHREACAGRGGLVLVSGPAGAGKTRLVREFAASLAGSGTEVLTGRCYDVQPAVPFGPFLDAVQALVRAHGVAEVREATGSWAAELGKLLPELEGPSPAPRTTDPAGEKRRLFEAIVRVLRPRAGTVRLLVLEDLQWSDETSGELLDYLGHAAEHERLLVLATYRTPGPADPSLPTPLLDRLRRAWRGREVALPPLSRDEVCRMLHLAVGTPLPGRLVDALYDRTEGNPLFVEEVLHTLVEGGRLDELVRSARRGERLPVVEIPASAQESIVQRTDFELLLRLTGLQEAFLLRALEELVAQHLVLEETDGPRTASPSVTRWCARRCTAPSSGATGGGAIAKCWRRWRQDAPPRGTGCWTRWRTTACRPGTWSGPRRTPAPPGSGRRGCTPTARRGRTTKWRWTCPGRTPTATDAPPRFYLPDLSLDGRRLLPFPADWNRAAGVRRPPPFQPSDGSLGR
ncbi:MAG TPA: AAA family ATPase [Longimicrobiaceae bacterium]|nr:AAA family ATPase [Longimicrobiaceae bacterium]